VPVKLNSIKSDLQLEVVLELQGISEGRAFKLIPLTEEHLRNDDYISKIVNGRKDNSASFFARFEVTQDGMRDYLIREPINRDDKILFLIIDSQDVLFGHIGLKIDERNRIEIDNVMRLERGCPGLIEKALNEVLKFVKTLGFHSIGLEVVSDNDRAINLYRKCGFEVTKTFYLNSFSSDNGYYSLRTSSKDFSNTNLKRVIMEKDFNSTWKA